MTPAGHDATSVVGKLAGLDTAKPKREPVTPDALATRFCGASASGLIASPTNGFARDEAKHCDVARGHCGYIGGRGDSMIVGFDDGYDWMGYLLDRGWGELAAKGDWPYLVYLVFRGKQPAIAEYCEGDLTVWRFDDAESAKRFYADLRNCP